MINMTLVTKDERMTRMAQHLDVFESFKIMGGINTLPVSPNMSLQHSFDKMMEMKDADPNLKVVAILFHGIKEPRFIDQSVKSISDGKKWITMDSIVKAVDGL